MKKWFRMIWMLFLVVGVIRILPSQMVYAATGDEVRAAKKIISVVYDDSGSMGGDKWAYANYATQALTALLNEQDDLYMTYMSDPLRSIKVDMTDIPNAVAAIRDWAQSGSTPGTALDTANDTLEDVVSTDPTVQYWLVIMTDGEIDMSTPLQTKLDSFKGRKMNNGTKLNVVYLAMGENAYTAKADPSGGLYTYYANATADIANSMQEIANLVSGRISAANVTQVDDNTIQFSSALPLYSISILSQGSVAQVTGAESQEQTLNVNRNIPLYGYDASGYSTTILLGNAAVISLQDESGNGKVIQSGTYTITFSEAVNVANLVVQYEPAIGMDVVITRDGIEITDFTQLTQADKVTVEIFPVIPGTDTVIPEADLPDGIAWTINYLVNDNTEDNGSGTKLTGVSIKDGKNVLQGIMSIPGFAETVYQIEFDVVTHIYAFGITVDQPIPLTYYRSHVEDGSQEGGDAVFWLADNGVPMTKEAMDDAGITLEIENVTCDSSGITGWVNKFGRIKAKCSLEQNDDGSFTLYPDAVLPLTAFLMVAGEYEVTVCVDKEPDITGVATFSMLPHEDDWGQLPGFLISFFGILYLLYIIFIKHKFRGQTVYYDVYRLINNKGVQEGAQSGSKKISFMSGGLLLPTRACRVKFYGLTLEAGPDGSIMVLGKSIARTVYAYKQTSADPKYMGTIVATMKKTERVISGETTRTADDLSLTDAAPIYLRSDESDREIWCIYTQN